MRSRLFISRSAERRRFFALDWYFSKFFLEYPYVLLLDDTYGSQCHECRLRSLIFISHTSPHPPQSSKILSLRFFRKSHTSFLFSRGVGICNRKFSISTRSRVIGVFNSVYYVFYHFFALRVVFRVFFTALRARYELPRTLWICIELPVDFYLLLEKFSTLLIHVFYPKRLFAPIFALFIVFCAVFSRQFS